MVQSDYLWFETLFILIIGTSALSDSQPVSKPSNEMRLKAHPI